MVAAPLPGAPQGSFLLVLPGGCRCFLDSEILGGDGKVLYMGGHQNPFPAASKCSYFHLSLAVVFPLSSLTPTSQCSQTSFQGHGLGRGKSNFSFLLQLSCKSLDFHIYFPGSLCAIILIRSLLPLLCYSTHTLNLKKKIKAVISYFHK